jgi:hypothetical protein
MAKTKSPSGLIRDPVLSNYLSKHEALVYREKIGKKTSLMTLNSAVTGVYPPGPPVDGVRPAPKPVPEDKRLRVAHQFQVADETAAGHTRTFDVFTRESVRDWKPGHRASSDEAATKAAIAALVKLGLDPEAAKNMAARVKADAEAAKG